MPTILSLQEAYESFVFPLDINLWGSCQYNEEYQRFQFYLKLRRMHWSSLDIMMIMGLPTDPSKIIPKNKLDILQTFRQEMKEDLDEQRAEPWTDSEEEEDYQRRVAALGKVNSVPAMFKFLREQAWDLWSAAPFIAYIAFGEYDNPTREPANFWKEISTDTITSCILLHYHKLIRKPNEAFAHFDT